SYGVVYHAKWHNGLRYCEGGARCKKKVADVAIKEIKSGYDVTLDFISMIETHLQCFYEDQSCVSRKLLKLYGIAQNPKTKSYIIVMEYKEGG
ncbi:19636_t:CDS:2, partial [Entrophospora sp. SA101]